MDCLVFYLNENEYAYPVDQIVEIINLQTLTKLPKAKPFVKGVINLRGSIITVFSFIENIKTEKKKSKILIINLKKHTIGILVTKIKGIFPTCSVSYNPKLLERFNTQFIKEIVSINGKFIPVIEPEFFFKTGS